MHYLVQYMPQELTKRERQAMDVIYANGNVTVSEVQNLLPDNPSYSATRILLRRLSEKGLLKITNQGNRYTYSASIPRAAAGKAALKRLVDTFYDGSPSNLFSALLGISSESISPEELAELEALIAEAKSRIRK